VVHVLISCDYNNLIIVPLDELGVFSIATSAAMFEGVVAMSKSKEIFL
jgi:hypothetical protein